MAELLFKDESFRIIGICMKIHQALGMGLKEVTYKDAIEMDFTDEGIVPYREKRYAVQYKNKILANPYIADFIAFDKIVLEIKSTPLIHDNHKLQALSYLGVSGLKLAIVINFGERSLTYKRILL